MRTGTYDIDEPGGMERAKEWTAGLISMIKDPGVWLVPRSCSSCVISKTKMTAARWSGGDSAVERVLSELGYTIEE